MLFKRRAALALLFVLCLICAACSSEAPAGSPGADAPRPQLPSLDSLPRTAMLSGELRQDGADYLDELAHQNVARDGLIASYSPQGEEFPQLAFAIHHFDLSGMGGSQLVSFSWEEEWPHLSEPPNFWLALPNWGAGKWDWFSTATADSFSVADISPYIRAEDGASYLVLLFSGSINPRLLSLEFASAPVVESVSPLTLPSGMQVQMSAEVSGSAPFTYAWNFGDACSPSTSSEASPLVTAGAAGTYSCSLDVSNAVGSDSFPFSLTIGEGHGEGWVHTLYPSSAAVDSVVDASGNLIVLTGGFHHSSISPEGALNWSRVYFMNNPDTQFSGRGIALDSVGDIYIGGVIGDTIIGSSDGIFLAKFSAADGSHLWLRRWTSEGFRSGGALAIDSLDNIYVTGSSREPGQGLDDAVLLKFSSAGELLQQQLWGTAGSDYGEALCIAGDDSVFLSGYTNTNLPMSDFTTFLLKFDDQGSLLREQGFEGSNDSAMALRPDGSLVMCFSGGSDGMLLELDEDGDLKWAKSYLHSASSHFADLLLAADGSIIISGAFRTDKLQDKLDCVITHASAAGELLSARWWDFNADHESFETLCAGPDGSVFMCGYSCSQLGIWLDIAEDVSASAASPGPFSFDGAVTATALSTTDTSLNLSIPATALDEDNEFSKALLMRYSP